MIRPFRSLFRWINSCCLDTDSSNLEFLILHSSISLVLFSRLERRLFSSSSHCCCSRIFWFRRYSLCPNDSISYCLIFNNSFSLSISWESFTNWFSYSAIWFILLCISISCTSNLCSFPLPSSNSLFLYSNPYLNFLISFSRVDLSVWNLIVISLISLSNILFLWLSIIILRSSNSLAFDFSAAMYLTFHLSISAISYWEWVLSISYLSLRVKSTSLYFFFISSSSPYNWWQIRFSFSTSSEYLLFSSSMANSFSVSSLICTS